MEEISETIKRKRTWLMVHAYIYYMLDDNLVTDAQYDTVCVELVDLQKAHGVNHEFYDEVFYDWTGATGMHLPSLMRPQLISRAIDVYERNKPG